jgi:UDP-N-acetylmuramate dehydrogenase
MWLSWRITYAAGEKFNVWLQPEVRFIGATGEVNAESIA